MKAAGDRGFSVAPSPWFSPWKGEGMRWGALGSNLNIQQFVLLDALRAGMGLTARMFLL
jgi:hypothetical protein